MALRFFAICWNSWNEPVLVTRFILIV
jgi:hypothetical protein